MIAHFIRSAGLKIKSYYTVLLQLATGTKKEMSYTNANMYNNKLKSRQQTKFTRWLMS